MGKWSQASRTHVAHMRHGDFYHSDTFYGKWKKATSLNIELVADDGSITVLKKALTGA